MVSQTPPSSDAAQLAIFQRKLTLENKFKGGINWFFWIAGLSLINTIFYLIGFSLTFVIGLGATQIVDGFMSGLAATIGEAGFIARMIGFVINLFIAGAFVLFGVLGRKHIRWAIILGMVLYAIDGIIVLVFKDFLGAAFHALALFGIWSGLMLMKEMKLLEEAGTNEAFMAVSQQAALLQKPPTTNKVMRTITLVIVGFLLITLIIFVIFLVQQ